MATLKERTISSIFWSLMEKVGGKGVGVLSTIILARLLTPEDFGLVGMLSVFISVSQGIADGGFNKALIQKEKADNEDYSSVFYINLVVSILMYGVMYLASPWIAEFYNQPLLIEMMRILSFVFIINAFSYVQKSRLQKQMRFRTLMFIHLPSVLVSAGVAIYMAYTGWGVWSLIAQQLVMRFVYAVQIWIYARWRPLLSFNGKKAKGLFSFGSRILLSSIVDTIYLNIYLIVIGKFFPVSTLGYYKNADNLTRIPVNSLSSALKSVTFPSFSTIQNDDKRLKSGYKKTMQQVFFWVCPFMVIAAVLATPLFRFLLTEKWLPAVPYFRILCLFGLIASLNSFNVEIVAVKGHANLYFKLKVIKKIIATVLIVIAIPMGIWALLWSQVLQMFIGYLINSHYSGKYINYPVKEQLKDVFPTLALGLAVGGILMALNLYFNNIPDLAQLLIVGGLGIGFYWLLARQFNFDPYHEIKGLLGVKISKVFTNNRSN